MRYRRGDAAVIGNLIMIAASVLMASIVMFWTFSFQQSAGSSFSQAIFQSAGQASEQFSIDDVNFVTGTPKTMRVYVRNFGDEPIKVVQVYVDSVNYTTTQTVVVARTYAAVTVQYSGWASGETHVIRVATERGGTFERSFRVP